MTPSRIVEALINPDNDEGMNDHIADFMARHGDEIGNKYELIDGDINAWDHGGTFYNPRKQELVHVDGLEGEGLRDTNAWDIDLTNEQMTEIMERFPKVPDPDDPDSDDNEDVREEAVDVLKDEIAEEKNRNRKLAVYITSVEPVSKHDWHGISGLEDVDWDNATDAIKWCAIGNYHGWHEVDPYPSRMTKAELEKYLGLEL